MRSIYFHGMPGSPAELAIAKAVSLSCVARHLPPAEMAEQIRGDYPGEDLHFVGFSLGAAYALQLSAHIAPARLDLIAPAAPLETGDFLRKMAGSLVFRAAQHPPSLALLTQLQAALLVVAPRVFLRSLFASAAEADRRLLDNEDCRRHLLTAFRDALGPGRKAYLHEVMTYAKGHWDLPHLTCPVTIWQGTSDTWVPPEMARALAATVPGSILNTMPGLGHFSALQMALPQIMTGLERSNG